MIDRKQTPVAPVPSHRRTSILLDNLLVRDRHTGVPSRDPVQTQGERSDTGQKYRGLGQPIFLVAVEFSRETRNLVAFEVERA